MKQGDISSGLVLLAISVILFILSFTIHQNFVSGDTLGSRFFPRVVALLLAVCALVIIRSGLKAQQNDDDSTEINTENEPKRNLPRALWTVGLSFAYAILYVPLGVLITTPLFVWAMLLAWGETSKIKMIAIPVLGTAFIYLMFGVWFGIMLPMGPLG